MVSFDAFRMTVTRTFTGLSASSVFAVADVAVESGIRMSSGTQTSVCDSRGLEGL